jgi:hypothetical protein
MKSRKWFNESASGGWITIEFTNGAIKLDSYVEMVELTENLLIVYENGVTIKIFNINTIKNFELTRDCTVE